MENIILAVHLIMAVAIIALILLQQGKGAEMGASFGSGASQTVFGSSGSGNFFSRLTAILAAVFFATSFSLAVISKQSPDVGSDIPAMQEINGAAQEEDSDIPAVDEESDIPAVEQDSPASDVPAPPATE